MSIKRNIDDHFAHSPTPHYPRSRFDMGILKRLQTQTHGRLYPFFCRMVYPGDTWKMDLSTFVRMDTSAAVPLDDIFLDTYFFFVPLRIIDQDFPKVLGEGEPEDYDDVSYGIPQLTLDSLDEHTINDLLPYLGYAQKDATVNSSTHIYYFNYDDEICPYPMAAYYKIYNDWFRDENLDSSIPYTDLYNDSWNSVVENSALFDYGQCLRVNRYHDYFASAMIAPQKGPAVTIPLGTSAPVGVDLSIPATLGNNISNGVISKAGSYSAGSFVPVFTGSITTPADPYVADLTNAAGTINELYLAMAIQSLYTKRATFGTRYIETIRGQWGIDVPDSFFLRPEYLGGSRVTLNNVPVLSTENSSKLGNMAGNSSTLANGGSFTKTFIEYGLLLGLACTRVKHSYMQGKRKELFSLKTHLDLYNPVYCNIGPQPIMRNEICNRGTQDKDVVFAYQEAWANLRSDVDTYCGLFGNVSEDNSLKTKWHYGDIYTGVPSFNATWLKEHPQNVSRTLTGTLIAGAPGDDDDDSPQQVNEGHQFMFGFYYHPVVTRVMSSRSQVPELFGRL